MSRLRGYCFTRFQGENKSLDPPMFDARYMRWLIFSREVCPETGREHIQGFVYFLNGKTRHAADVCLGGGCHLEKQSAYSSFKQQVAYIQGPWEKDGKSKPLNPTFVELGVMPEPGKKTNLKKLVDQVMSGEVTLDQIAVDTPMMWHQYGRTLTRVAALRLKKKARQGRGRGCKGTWYFGPTGSGKSHRAFGAAPPGDTYLWTNDAGWWDGYEQQLLVVMNDFRGELAYAKMLQMVDKWPCNVPRRYTGPVPFASERLIVTSSRSPGKTYSRRNEEDKIAQLYRRFEVFRCYFADDGSRALEQVYEEEEIHFVLV